MDGQVDHIQPKSKGGPHTTGNAQLLTTKENRQKSNKEVRIPTSMTQVRK